MTTVIGIYAITQNAAEPADSYWQYVKQYEWLMPAWLNFLAKWKITEKPGAFGPSFATLTIGYKRKEGTMETPVALGFLRLLMNENQWKHYLAVSKQINRRITPSEAYSIFQSLPRKSVTPQEEANMQKTWNEFYKKTKGADGAQSISLDTIEKWGIYVQQNYAEPLPDVTKQGWDA